MKESLKKIGALIALMLWVIGVIAGIGYACYCGAYVVAIGVAFVGVLSWPQVKEIFKFLTKK